MGSYTINADDIQRKLETRFYRMYKQILRQVGATLYFRGNLSFSMYTNVTSVNS